MRKGRHLASLVERVVGQRRGNDGRALEAVGVQVRDHLRGARKLHLAMRENAIVVLQIDVDVQAVDRNARFTIGAADALDPATIVVAVAALMEPEGVFGRHRAPPGQACELVQDVRDAVAQKQVVVQFAEEGAKGVPAPHVVIGDVADVEEGLRQIIEEKPITVRLPGVVADWRPIDLDQQRDRRVERLRRIECAALAAGRDRRTGVDEVVVKVLMLLPFFSSRAPAFWPNPQ